MSTDENYIGREQSRVKHFILKKYLQAFANIIGSTWNTISYVDCFSGPWESNAPDLSDTSFAIALRELQQARDVLATRRKSLRFRCLFLEKDAKAHTRLASFVDQQQNVDATTLNKTVVDAIPDIVKFLKAGRDSFAFTFIDPTGWDGFDLQKIKPLLLHRPGEVLINFMTEHIRRFATGKEKREKVIESFTRLFGSEEVFERIAKIEDSQDREDELFMSYAAQVRSVGRFEFVCPSVVLHPLKDRTYFHLIYATRNRTGVEKYKQVEKAAFEMQEQLRAEATEREQVRKTKQPTFFSVMQDVSPTSRVIALRERYLMAAKKRVGELRKDRTVVPFDEIWDAALAFPLVWDSDVKDWIKQWKAAGEARVLNLKPRQRTPQWGENHSVEFQR